MPEDTIELRAIGLVSGLLRAKEQMERDPRTWSIDDAEKSRYYRLLNRVCDLVERGLRTETPEKEG